ncbi:hypothetical protein STRDD10_01188 [Streptococcus sp. DD10]|uniref:HAD hydrolase family protein n=1 Tax=Streptococcus sp. DD10 TaxID=1777878 RepID=UPI000796D196|nr:HAD hydrolase family protein [Streptococcus sp. DD10]KXT74120.1 hypothetical protein STRDD10_01188 [Streptococcus sp. DD10]
MQFVFDLDGTLSFDNTTIDKEIKQALLTAPKYGHQVAFATARSYRDCLGLLGEELKNHLVIGLNGGLVYEDGQCRLEKHLEQQAYTVLLSWCLTYNLPFIVDNCFDYSGQIFEKIPFFSGIDPLNQAQRLDLTNLKSPIKLVIYMGDHEDLLDDTIHHLEKLQSLYLSYHAHERCLYVNPADTHKATTIVEICGHDFIAFGNDQNDIEMLQASLYAVQIGNFPGLKAYRDEQVPYQENQSAAVAAKIVQVFSDFRGR